MDGKLDFEENTFDLITCFGTLHHIPNVTYVWNEMIRVLKPNGFLLIREPILSMEDWRNKRPGLTKNERGIPTSVFDSIFNNNPVKIVSKAYCFTLTHLIGKAMGRFLKNRSFHISRMCEWTNIYLCC